MRGGQQNDTSNLSKPQSCLHIEGRKNRLDGHSAGLKFLNQTGNQGMDMAEMTINKGSQGNCGPQGA